MSMNDADPCDPVVNGDEVRNITFGKGLYDASQVNELLDRIAAELDAGRPAGTLIASEAFEQRPFARGYNAGAVNWFLEQLWHREDPGEARLPGMAREVYVPAPSASRTAQSEKLSKERNSFMAALDSGACGHSGQKPRARRKPARTGRGPSPAQSEWSGDGFRAGMTAPAASAHAPDKDAM